MGTVDQHPKAQQVQIQKPSDPMADKQNELEQLLVNEQQAKLEQKEREKIEKEKQEELDPCTVFNPVNKGFINLQSLSSLGNEGKPLAWNTRGWDSGKNYTIGICSNPFKKMHSDEEIQDIGSVNATNIGAFYIDSKTNKFVSMGEYSTTPKFRGRKLTLTYENGAYCDNLIDGTSGQRLRKSTIITFTCDRELMTKAQISFVGSPNDCNYLFEVRSHHACPTAAKENNMAAIWIFLFILLAALFVYFSGGLLYRQMKQVKQTPKGL